MAPPSSLATIVIRHKALGREIGAEILQSLKDMKAGKGQVVLSSAAKAHEATGLSPSQVARLLAVSVRTSQGWEPGRNQPSRAARTLLAIAKTNPKGGRSRQWIQRREA